MSIKKVHIARHSFYRQVVTK